MPNDACQTNTYFDEAQVQANELYWQMLKATGNEKEELMNRREIIGSQAGQFDVDIHHRFSSDRATRSNLAVLSTAALACGAYLVVDQENSEPGHIIKLCGATPGQINSCFIK